MSAYQILGNYTDRMKVQPDGSEDHIIIGIMEQLQVFLSRIARQHAFFLDLVLMREMENLLVEMGDGILNGKSGRIVGERTKIG